MEFQAYPSTAQTDRSFILRVQRALHGSDSVLLPAILVAVGSLLVVHQHMTDPDTGRHSVRNFLAKILVSMFPLVVLERKILQCPDPVGLFAKFSAKVMLMHVNFLFLRLACLVFPDVKVGFKYANSLGFLAGCIMLPVVFKFRPSRASFAEHSDVWCITVSIVVLALIEVSLLGRFGFHNKWTRNMFIEDAVLTGSDYIEILAFVPAAWMACRKDEGNANTALEDSQRRAVCLFAYLAAFYSMEDLANAMLLRTDYPLASCAHCAHYLLLMDFSGFLLAHLYDPEKFAKTCGKLRSWVLDVCMV